MSDYTKTTNFTAKDSLPTGNPSKVIRGAEFDTEFEAIETAVSSKADLNDPILTGAPKAPTAAAGTNTTQIATCAFVNTAVSSATLGNASITNEMMADNSVGADEIIDNSVGANELNISGDGTAGQVLTSDGDGSFSWADSESGVASTSAGAVGQLAFLATTYGAPAIGFGDTVDTSAVAYSLYPAGNKASGSDNNTTVVIEDTATAVTGTWRCLGYMSANTYADNKSASLFVRVS